MHDWQVQAATPDLSQAMGVGVGVGPTAKPPLPQLQPDLPLLQVCCGYQECKNTQLWNMPNNWPVREDSQLESLVSKQCAWSLAILHILHVVTQSFGCNHLCLCHSHLHMSSYHHGLFTCHNTNRSSVCHTIPAAPVCNHAWLVIHADGTGFDCNASLASWTYHHCTPHTAATPPNSAWLKHDSAIVLQPVLQYHEHSPMALQC